MYYRKRLTFSEISPYIQEFLQFLRANCPVIKPGSEDDYEEAFLFDIKRANQARAYEKYYSLLVAGGYMMAAPITTDESVMILYFNSTAYGTPPTVSASHVRMPKLSCLITLTPEDFFTCFKLVATAKLTSTKDALQLNPAANGIQSLSTHILAPYFTLLKTNYRINPTYAGNKWMPYEDIRFIASLEPNRDNQLSAMQYITARQNEDLLYFPTETAINLELEWPQITDEYVTPAE